MSSEVAQWQPQARREPPGQPEPQAGFWALRQASRAQSVAQFWAQLPEEPQQVERRLEEAFSALPETSVAAQVVFSALPAAPAVSQVAEPALLPTARTESTGRRRAWIADAPGHVKQKLSGDDQVEISFGGFPEGSRHNSLQLQWTHP